MQEYAPSEERPQILKDVVLDGIVLSEMYVPAYKYEPTVYTFQIADSLPHTYTIHVQPSAFVTLDTMAELIEPGCRVLLGPLTISPDQREYEIEAHQIAAFDLPKEPPLSSKTLNTLTDLVVADGTQ